MIWFWINDELTKHTNKSILLSCILCGKWILCGKLFWINDHLRNHIRFDHPNNPPCVHFVWKMVLNQRSAEEPCHIWAPNQFTIPLSPSSSFTSGVPLSSLLSSPQEFGSCKLCGEDFSIDSWLKMHIISKHQTNSQQLSLSFFLVHIWSLFSICPLRHLWGVWIADLCEET